MKKDITLLLLNANDTVIENAKTMQVKKIIPANNQYKGKPVGEMKSYIDAHAHLVKEVFEKGDFTHLLAASSPFTKDVLFYLSGKMGIQPMSEITNIIDEETFVRPFYAGNAIQKIKNKEDKKIFTIRATSFETDDSIGSGAVVGDEVTVECDSKVK